MARSTIAIGRVGSVAGKARTLATIRTSRRVPPIASEKSSPTLLADASRNASLATIGIGSSATRPRADGAKVRTVARPNSSTLERTGSPASPATAASSSPWMFAWTGWWGRP